MLIVLHICSFLMMHDSEYTNLGDSGTLVSNIISNNQSREMYCDVFVWIWFLTALFIWWFLYWIRFSTFKDDLITNAIFLKIFWHLMVTQPFLYFQVSQVYMFSSQWNIFVRSLRWIFISSPVGFVVSPVSFLISRWKIYFLGLSPENFFYHTYVVWWNLLF